MKQVLIIISLICILSISALTFSPAIVNINLDKNTEYCYKQLYSGNSDYYLSIFIENISYRIIYDEYLITNKLYDDTTYFDDWKGFKIAKICFNGTKGYYQGFILIKENNDNINQLVQGKVNINILINDNTDVKTITKQELINNGYRVFEFSSLYLICKYPNGCINCYKNQNKCIINKGVYKII